MDVRKPEAVKLAVDTCIHEIGLPHVIINNAAGNFICPSEKLSANAFRNIVDIVLNGSAYVTLEFGKRLIEKGQGDLHSTSVYYKCLIYISFKLWTLVGLVYVSVETCKKLVHFIILLHIQLLYAEIKVIQSQSFLSI